MAEPEKDAVDPRLKPCSTCGGFGQVRETEGTRTAPEKWNTCPTCKGAGKVER